MTDIPPQEGEPTPSFDFNQGLSERDAMLFYDPRIIIDRVLIPMAEEIEARTSGAEDGPAMAVETQIDGQPVYIAANVTDGMVDDKRMQGITVKFESIVENPAEQEELIKEMIANLERGFDEEMDRHSADSLIKGAFGDDSIPELSPKAQEFAEMIALLRKEGVRKPRDPRVVASFELAPSRALIMRDYVTFWSAGALCVIGDEGIESYTDELMCLIHWSDIMLLRSIVEELGLSEDLIDVLTEISAEPLELTGEEKGTDDE